MAEYFIMELFPVDEYWDSRQKATVSLKLVLQSFAKVYFE